MSDTFDHELDAWESFDRSMDEGYGYAYNPRRRSRRIFVKDSNYFHKWYHIDGVVAETPRAIMIKFNGLNFWVPKSICAIIWKKRILAHRTTFRIIFEKALPPGKLLSSFEV